MKKQIGNYDVTFTNTKNGHVSGHYSNQKTGVSTTFSGTPNMNVKDIEAKLWDRSKNESQ